MACSISTRLMVCFFCSVARHHSACRSSYVIRHNDEPRRPPECQNRAAAPESHELADRPVWFPAADPAPGTSGSKPGLRALPDQTALELGQGREHMENQLARRAAYLDLLRQALKTHALPLKVGHDLHQVGQTAAKPVQPPDDKGISSPQRLPALRKLRTGGVFTTGRFVIKKPAVTRA